jgi:copper chaperone CopZ
MIVSTVSGRIRVRSNRLKSERLANNIRRNAEQLVGVSEVRVNPAAGSLVVSYDTRLVDTIDLEDQLEALCLPATAAKNGKSSAISKHVNRATKVGMMTTLATSLAYGYLGNKKAHIRFGTAFVAFAAMHMLRYQSTLVR